MTQPIVIEPDVVEKDETYRYDDGDSERFSHIVYRPGGNANVAIMEARVLGTPIEALCGKMWIPQRDPSRFPVCKTCLEIAQEIRGGIS